MQVWNPGGQEPTQGKDGQIKSWGCNSQGTQAPTHLCYSLVTTLGKPCYTAAVDGESGDTNAQRNHSEGPQLICGFCKLWAGLNHPVMCSQLPEVSKLHSMLLLSPFPAPPIPEATWVRLALPPPPCQAGTSLALASVVTHSARGGNFYVKGDEEVEERQNWGWCCGVLG